ncbi:MAG: hypothetical protein RL577_902 [Bacteroidota bacterium]
MRNGTLAFLALFVSSLFPLQSLAQSATVFKAKTALNSGDAGKALKICTKGLEKDKSLIELWYIKAASEYHIWENRGDDAELSSYLRESVKSAIKAQARDEFGDYKAEYTEVFAKIATENNVEAMANYGQGRYSRAIQMYRNSYDLSNDTFALGMMGVCYHLSEKTREGLGALKQCALWNYGASASGLHSHTYVREAYEILAEYYDQKKQFDSAQYYAEMGLSVYPQNRKLLALEHGYLETNIQAARSRSGIGSLFLENVIRALEIFPADSNFLSYQNSYYINKMGYVANRGDYTLADTLFMEFYMQKQVLVEAGIRNESDPFLKSDSLAFLGQCLQYYLGSNNEAATVYFFYKWYPLQFKSPAINEKGLEVLLKNPPAQISRRLIVFLLDHATRSYPTNKVFKGYRKTLFDQYRKGPIKAYEWSQLIAMSDSLMHDFPKDKTLKPLQRTLLMAACDSAIKDGRMLASWTYMQRLQRQYGYPADIQKLHERLAKQDFEIRYKGSKIGYEVVNGLKTPQTGWDGYSKHCIAGHMPDSTIQRVEARMNYFRQNAGIQAPISYSKIKGDACQEAAILFAPVGMFTREPTPETHGCYTEEAAYAAAMGHAIMEPNPAIAATVLFEDNKSEELFNRQMLMNPSSYTFGFGAAENNSVFWVVDDGEVWMDSLAYQNRFVSWPPNGYAPAMLAFETWSFSSTESLADAQVEVSTETYGKLDAHITLVENSFLPMNALVINHGKQKQELKAGDIIRIKVKLKSGKIYQTETHLF